MHQHNSVETTEKQWNKWFGSLEDKAAKYFSTLKQKIKKGGKNDITYNRLELKEYSRFSAANQIRCTLFLLRNLKILNCYQSKL